MPLDEEEFGTWALPLLAVMAALLLVALVQAWRRR
jgi:hypothetical protein